MNWTLKDRNIIFSRITFLIVIISLCIIGIIYTVMRWSNSVKETEQKAIQLAEVAEAGIQKSAVVKLNAHSSDLERLEYKELKNSLVSIVRLNNDIRFSYIFVQKNEKIYFLADSESVDSKDYSPPGQEYWEADEALVERFQIGETYISKPTPDRWGTWVSVLVPMKDINTGEIIAVFGVDFPAETWYEDAIAHAFQAAVIFLCFIVISVLLFYSLRKNAELRTEKKRLEKTSLKLRNSEKLFRTVFEQAPIGIAVMQKYNFYSNINPAFEKILGRNKEELTKLSWKDITHPDDMQISLDYFSKFISHEIGVYQLNKRYIKPDGSNVWVSLTVTPFVLKNDKEEELNHLCLIEDITERIKSEKALNESERSKSVLLSNLPGMAYRCCFDKNWTMQFVSEGCFALTGYKSESLIFNRDLSYSDLIAPGYQDTLWHEWKLAIANKRSFRYEYELITASGKRKWVLELGQGVYNESGDVVALEGIVIDITDRKTKEKQIEYMIDHDYLTGLYNRKYFEESLDRLDRQGRLPLTVLIVDINGVRLINDAFGYTQGDKMLRDTSELLKDCCRPEDILARMGGDEFVLLLPDTNNETALKIMNQIQTATDNYNKNKRKLFELNLSVGYAIKENKDESINDTVKAADVYLRNQKLLNSNSFHSHLVSSMMATLYERSEETEEHSKRLAVMSKNIGEKLKLTRKELGELELLAMLHDIGKVGVEDRVLKKPGKLNDDERAIMKMHTEIGYRIAKSTKELEAIAEYILTHHERFDGTGYPNGLKGEEIPVLSRILSVADAYDAMTNDRIYRKAIPTADAVEEIKKKSGTQFDPKVVEAFLSIEK